jgi:hypothetical protein
MKRLAVILPFLAMFLPMVAEVRPADEVKQTAMLTAKELAQSHAAAISRALVQLRLDEVAAEQAAPVDKDKLGLIQAQEKALQKDLVDLVLAPLEAELKRNAELYQPAHPKMIQLQKRIEEAKALLSGIH